MDGTPEMNQMIYKSRNTLLEIMAVRGYDISDHSGFSYSDVSAMSEHKQLDMFLTHQTDGRKIYIRYNVSGTFRRPIELTDLVEDMFTIDETLARGDDLMIITLSDPNDTMTKLMSKIWYQDKIYVSIVNIARLQFNILNHRLVPKHTILSDDDKAAVMKRYNIASEKQMPVISRFEPVAAVLGVRPDQVVHIERPSKTAITSDYWRVCI
jgi:DNA-directed RNA polymerase subunit H (RpoH/RPB5)